MVWKANVVVVAAVISALSGCASINRATEYRATFADARNFSTAFEMQISVHPVDDTLLVNPRVYLAGPIVTPPEPGPELIRSVVVEFFGETGCAVSEIRRMARPWFEASFVCPEGFDVRGAVAAQREALRGGAALQREGV